MNRRPLIVVGVAAFFVGLLAHVPASLLAWGVQARLPAVKLAGIDGTALRGRAQYMVADGVVVEGVEWRLRPATLSADLIVTTDNGRLRGTVRPGPGGGIRVTDAEANASLAWFGRLAGYPQLPVSGDVHAVLSEAAVDGDLNPSRIDGRVSLTGARWQLARPPVPLGGFTGELSAEGGAVTLKVVESEGPLAVDGSARLTGGGSRYGLDLTLRPRPGAEDRLKSMLGFLGKPDAQGIYRIRERGRF